MTKSAIFSSSDRIAIGEGSIFSEQ